MMLTAARRELRAKFQVRGRRAIVEGTCCPRASPLPPCRPPPSSAVDAYAAPA